MGNFFVQPVIGYRAWHINAGSYGLNSPVCKQEWEDDGPTKASCRPTIVYAPTKRPLGSKSHLSWEHESPDKACWCGLHGWHRPQETHSYLDDGVFSIVGACLAWGKYRVATKGFRIQYMQPLALVDPNPDRLVLGWAALRQKATERYQIPLLEQEDLQDYAEQFGKPMGLEFTT